METPNLRLRRFNLADAKKMAELESDPEVMRFTSSRVPQSFEQTQARLEALIHEQPSHSPLGVWAVELKESGDFVGWFMLMKKRHVVPELGYMIVRRHWGKGYASEAARRLVEFGVRDLKLPAMIATTTQDNAPSKRVLEKLGFHHSKVVTVLDNVLQKEVTLEVFELIAAKLDP